MKTPENAPDNNVGRKTPEEIKKGLAICIYEEAAGCNECAFFNMPHCYEKLGRTAILLIQQLESRLVQAERERDAAVNALREAGFCCDCKYIDVPAEKEPCFSCRKRMYATPNWEWRGVVPENTKEDAE